MPKQARPPGQIRDTVVQALRQGEASAAEIYERVEQILGEKVAPSSVRSCLNLHRRDLFARVAHGRYRLRS